MTGKCSYCYEGDVTIDRPGFIPICETCLRQGLCYFCRQRPSVKSPPNPRTGVQIPTCDACWDQQIEMAQTQMKVKAGCLFVVGLVVVALVFAIRSC